MAKILTTNLVLTLSKLAKDNDPETNIGLTEDEIAELQSIIEDFTTRYGGFVAELQAVE